MLYLCCQYCLARCACIVLTVQFPADIDECTSSPCSSTPNASVVCQDVPGSYLCVQGERDVNLQGGRGRGQNDNTIDFSMYMCITMCMQCWSRPGPYLTLIDGIGNWGPPGQVPDLLISLSSHTGTYKPHSTCMYAGFYDGRVLGWCIS